MEIGAAYTFLPTKESKRHAGRQHAVNKLAGLTLAELRRWSAVVITEMDFAANASPARSLNDIKTSLRCLLISGFC